MTEKTLKERITDFLAGAPHAVVGASADQSKYGNKVLRAYMQSGREVLPINPREEQIEGIQAYPSLEALPNTVHGISIVTPPAVTEQVVQSAIALGIKNIWMQPGTVSEEAVKQAVAHGINVIAAEACILVVLGYREKKPGEVKREKTWS